MWLSSGTATLPMVLMFLPCPWGVGAEGQVWLNKERRQEQGRCDETEKERHLLLISMGKFPRSWRLGWSPPDRTCWLLWGSPFASSLPQASLTLIQSNPSEWVSLCLLQHTPNKPLANTNSNKRSLVYCVSSFRCSWSSFFFFFMGNSYNPEQELTVSHDVLASHHTAVIPLVTTKPGGAALFIFFWLALHIFTCSWLGVLGVSDLRSFNTSSFHYGSKLITTPSNPHPTHHDPPPPTLSIRPEQPDKESSAFVDLTAGTVKPAFNHRPSQSQGR